MAILNLMNNLKSFTESLDRDQDFIMNELSFQIYHAVHFPKRSYFAFGICSQTVTQL